MAFASISNNEKQKNMSLHSMHVSDTSSEILYDTIVRMAKSVFDVSIVLINIVDSDHQRFKSKVGLDISESKNISFCEYAISQGVTDNLGSRIFEIQDAKSDPIFANDPMVIGKPWIRYYLGFILQSRDFRNIGTFCLIDTKVHNFTNNELITFCDFGCIIQELLNRDAINFSSNSNQFYDELHFYDNFQKKIKEINTQLAEKDINFIEWRVLNIIVNNQLPTPAVVSHQLSISNSLVSSYLNKLELKQLIKRDNVIGYDRRIIKLSCSQVGEQLWLYGVKIIESFYE